MVNDNKTVNYFYLAGLQSNKSINILLFIVFLMTYLVTLTGDSVISILVTKSHQLQYPMFYFLKHLSVSELLFTTNITPNMLYIILNGGGFMSLAGCVIQLYVYSALGTVESLLLSVMSYDRYLAICNPLRYANLMNLQFCQSLVLSTWLLSFSNSLITIFLFCQLKICGSNVIDHYFCDLSPLMDRACSDISMISLEASCVSGTGPRQQHHSGIVFTTWRLMENLHINFLFVIRKYGSFKVNRKGDGLIIAEEGEMHISLEKIKGGDAWTTCFSWQVKNKIRRQLIVLGFDPFAVKEKLFFI
ncbi:olfactory receptor 6E1-like [Anomaloglossus baeobatrachus]|uniref:olfactory receptor 6E1-like n=1 Tax=Anomaloglossus baeobatrachus TaxID=238106 RepID=UPI003F4FF1E9